MSHIKQLNEVKRVRLMEIIPLLTYKTVLNVCMYVIFAILPTTTDWCTYVLFYTIGIPILLGISSIKSEVERKDGGWFVVTKKERPRLFAASAYLKRKYKRKMKLTN